MDTSKLKKFAQFARRALITQVSAKLESVVAENSAAWREHPDAMRKLEAAIARDSKDQVIERVAYTWFNRFCALRFMDVNELSPVRVVSPVAGQFQPEILAEAKAGHMDEGRVPDSIREQVRSLLDGRTPSADAQTEAYRLLIVAICNDLHKAMPFLFERIDDYAELLLPDDLLSNASILAYVREAMTPDVCEDVEVIGWLYQFYISEKKDEVFGGLKKNKKITAENIPAATQLFTPHWIVRYLVENSLGRLWLLNRPNSQLAAKMDYYIAPEDPETDFLRISRPEDIRICDPACGSGHMLTYGFDLLYAIYEEEGYEATEIPGLILTHNLYGIEIDDRAGALAAFALAMRAATKLGRRRFLRQAIQPNICVLQDVRFTPSEMQDMAAVVGSDLFTADFREMMGQFEQAKNFGSLIVPKLRDAAEVARVVRLKDFGGDLLLRELQERVLKVLEMAELLSPKYHVVVANPPYMSSKGMNAELNSFLGEHFPDGKRDLYAAFIERGFALLMPSGFEAMVTMESWMFLSSYEGLRGNMLREGSFHPFLHMPYLGKGGTSMGINFGTSAFVLQCRRSPDRAGDFICVRHFETDEDGVPLAFPTENERRAKVSSRDFTRVPGDPIAYWISDNIRNIFSDRPTIEDLAPVRQGFQTGNNDRFLRLWFEVDSQSLGNSCQSTEDFQSSQKRYAPYNKGGDYRRWYGNNEFVVKFDKENFIALSKSGNKLPSRDRYFRESITWTSISSGAFGARYNGVGFTFSANGACAFPEAEGAAELILSLLNSKVATKLLEFLTPTLDFSVGKIRIIPVALDELSAKEQTIYSSFRSLTEIAREDWDSDEYSWDFAIFPLLASVHRAETLAESYTCLRAHWRDMAEEMQRLEEENNRIFIDAYELQDELTPEVPIEEITLNCNPTYRYSGPASEAELETRLLAETMAEFLHYAVGCMFGRYSLDEPGLILANQGETLAKYFARVPQPTFEPDADNVIPVLDGDWFADDIAERFRKFLRVTFGEAKFQENLAFIEGALGKDIRKWFTRDFYDYHVRRYKKRPIYWMFASPKGSFQVLIYMHRYRPDTVSVVLNDYLREYRNKLEAHRKGQEAQSINPEATPAQRTKALKEVGEATKVIEELDGYERDVLYPLATQKIEIDLDDGVKSNYPKFGAALKPIKGLSDAGD